MRNPGAVLALAAVGVGVLIVAKKQGWMDPGSPEYVDPGWLPGSMSADPPAPAPAGSLKDQIRAWALAAGEDPALILALCEIESSFQPAAVSSDHSYGLMQIFHGPSWSWLRWAGYSDADQGRLFEPAFNVALGCEVVQYFRGRGFKFPADADIYNLGEKAWGEGTRNVPYRTKAITAFRKYGGAG